MSARVTQMVDTLAETQKELAETQKELADTKVKLETAERKLSSKDRILSKLLDDFGQLKKDHNILKQENKEIRDLIKKQGLYVQKLRADVAFHKKAQGSLVKALMFGHGVDKL